jgi:hypothetical protein
MLDTHTFLMELYVMVDDFCQSYEELATRPGPAASLSRSEVVTLGLFSQWQRFRSERDFYRFAQAHLRCLFPRLPHRSQFNRLLRRHHDVLAAFFVHGVQQLQGQPGYDFCYEALDTSAVPTRDAKRRGSGWLSGQAQIGWGNRLGWFEGFRLLISVNPQGIITGFCFGSGNAKDQPLAEDFLATRHQPHPRCVTVGARSRGFYVSDKGFEGAVNQLRWQEEYGAHVLCPPKRNTKSQPLWPKGLRQWVSGIRQVVESVYGKLHHTFGLDRERPHELTGFQVRLLSKVALHNFCVACNLKQQRPPLAFADLLLW